MVFPLSLLLQWESWTSSVSVESLHLCPGCHHLLPAQEPLLSMIFCLPRHLVSAGPAHQYCSETCSSLSQNKQNPSLDPSPPQAPHPHTPPSTQEPNCRRGLFTWVFHCPTSHSLLSHSELLSPLSQGPSEFPATKQTQRILFSSHLTCQLGLSVCQTSLDFQWSAPRAISSFLKNFS